MSYRKMNTWTQWPILERVRKYGRNLRKSTEKSRSSKKAEDRFEIQVFDWRISVGGDVFKATDDRRLFRALVNAQLLDIEDEVVNKLTKEFTRRRDAVTYNVSDTPTTGT